MQFSTLIESWEQIEALYLKYRDDLFRVKLQLQSSYNRMRQYASYDDIEAEVTYLLLREIRPAKVLECAPNHGWSTVWILSALRDNGHGHLESYDLIDAAVQMVPNELQSRWTFTMGDVFDRALATDYDYIFWDADHLSLDFTKRFLDFFSRQEKDIVISVHDIYHPHWRHIAQFEIIPVTSYIEETTRNFLAVAPIVRGETVRDVIPNPIRPRIDAFRAHLGLYNVHHSTVNPTVWFNHKGK